MLTYGPDSAVGDICALDFRVALSRDARLMAALAEW
jgi:hypothetical protein